MTAVDELHKVCVVVRKYPTTLFWLLSCSAFAAGIAANAIVLAVVLTVMLLTTGHMAHQMWRPPSRAAVGDRRDGDGRHVRSGN